MSRSGWGEALCKCDLQSEGRLTRKIESGTVLPASLLEKAGRGPALAQMPLCVLPLEVRCIRVVLQLDSTLVFEMAY